MRVDHVSPAHVGRKPPRSEVWADNMAALRRPVAQSSRVRAGTAGFSLDLASVRRGVFRALHDCAAGLSVCREPFFRRWTLGSDAANKALHLYGSSSIRLDACVLRCCGVTVSRAPALARWSSLTRRYRESAPSELVWRTISLMACTLQYSESEGARRGTGVGPAPRPRRERRGWKRC